MGNTMEEMEYEREEVEQKEGNALSMLVKGANLAVGAFGVLRALDRYIDTRSLLRRIGLSRRRSFWGSAALFGAGAVAGAGIAMFVAPMSGQQTRQGMMRGFRNIGRKGRELIQSAGSELSQLTEGMGIGHGEQGGREQGGREQQGGREHGGREQGREGARAGEQRGGEKGGEPRSGTTGSESTAGNANRGEAGKTLNR